MSWELFKKSKKLSGIRKKNKDQIEPTLNEIEDDEIESLDHRTKLINLIKSMPPSGFERLSQRLLRESGFQQVAVTGRSGDGGIDGVGVLQVNPFVSFNVLFQCKRYQGAVSPSQVRDFPGSDGGES